MILVYSIWIKTIPMASRAIHNKTKRINTLRNRDLNRLPKMLRRRSLPFKNMTNTKNWRGLFRHWSFSSKTLIRWPSKICSWNRLMKDINNSLISWSHNMSCSSRSAVMRKLVRKWCLSKSQGHMKKWSSSWRNCKTNIIKGFRFRHIQ